LNQACTYLTGLAIKNPATAAASPSIVSGDCTQLGKALTLVKMTSNLCGGNSNAGAEYPNLLNLYPLYQPKGLSSVVAFVGTGFKSGAGCIYWSGASPAAYQTGTVYVSANSQNQFLFCSFNGATFSTYNTVNASAANDLTDVQSGDTTSLARQYGTMGTYTNPQVGSWSSDGVQVTIRRSALGGTFNEYTGCNPLSVDDNGDTYDCLSCWWTSDFTTVHQFKGSLIDASSMSCKIPAAYNPYQTSFYYSLNGWAFSYVDPDAVISSASNFVLSVVLLIASLFVAFF